MSDMKLKLNDPMVLDLHVDLLVDGELTDEQRKQLLRAAEQDPKRWRAIAMRFLSRQTEKQAVKQLMGRAPLEQPDTAPYAFTRPVPAWQRWINTQSIAAGLMIALISAAATIYFMQTTHRGGNHGNTIATVTPTVETITAKLPGETLGLTNADAVKVEVPVARTAKIDTDLFAPAVSDEATKRSVIIQPDGNNGAVIIPVNTLPNLRVY